VITDLNEDSSGQSGRCERGVAYRVYSRIRSASRISGRAVEDGDCL
jgi:hypothetical protein